MANPNHPPQSPPGAPREIVACDYGGWISGPSITAEPIDAAMTEPGDIIVIDGQAATVEHVTTAAFADDGIGEYIRHGVAIWWRAGNSRGVLRRRGSDTLWIIAPDPS